MNKQTGPHTATDGRATTTNAPFIRSPYNYDLKAASDEASIKDFGESLTIQSMAEDADINVLVERMTRTGSMPEPPPKLPSYGDYTNVTDFRTALERVTAAQESFMAYPAKLRAQFDNDPGKFLEFVSDEKNRPEMERLGLLRPKTPEPPLSRDTQAIVAALKATGDPRKPEDLKSSGTT